MRLGVLKLTLFIPQVNSLKSKRKIVKGLKDKICHKFNVSVAEIEGQDKWQRAVLAVAAVNSSQKLLNSMLSQVVNLAELQAGTEVIDYSLEFF